MDSDKLSSTIGINIISIFTVLIVIMLFLMYMSYLSTNSKMNEFEHKIYLLQKEKEILLNNIQSIQNNDNLTTKDLDHIIKNIMGQIQNKNVQQQIPQNVKQYSVMTPQCNNQYTQRNMNHNIRELYPVPVIPGGEYLKRGVISMRNVDFPYQDLTTTYQRVGTISTVNKADDYMMTLYRRDIAPERDLYEYKVIDHTNGNNMEIFLNTNIQLLRNGDKLIIPGLESKGEFIVNLDRQYSYIRLRPFP